MDAWKDKEKEKTDAVSAAFAAYLDRIRERKPLIHSITNYVTATDVANMILACGASPVMADLPDEAAEVTAACQALNINMGTMKDTSLRAMLIAGQTASRLGRRVVLDPVGVGMSSYRRRAVRALLETVSFSVIRGNMSEILEVAALAGIDIRDRLLPDPAVRLPGQVQSASHSQPGGTSPLKLGSGIDAQGVAAASAENLDAYARLLQQLSGRLGCIITATGALDLVSDADRTYVISMGRPEMSRVIGTGCMLDGLLAAFAAVCPEEEEKNLTACAAAAVCCMDAAGEEAWKALGPGEGNVSYRDRIIDTVCRMSGQDLDQLAKGRVRCIH